MDDRRPFGGLALLFKIIAASSSQERMGTYRSEEVIDAYETRRVETHQMPAVTAGSSVSANNQGGNRLGGEGRVFMGFFSLDPPRVQLFVKSSKTLLYFEFFTNIISEIC